MLQNISNIATFGAPYLSRIPAITPLLAWQATTSVVAIIPAINAILALGHLGITLAKIQYTKVRYTPPQFTAREDNCIGYDFLSKLNKDLKKPTVIFKKSESVKKIHLRIEGGNKSYQFDSEFLMQHFQTFKLLSSDFTNLSNENDFNISEFEKTEKKLNNLIDEDINDWVIPSHYSEKAMDTLQNYFSEGELDILCRKEGLEFSSLVAYLGITDLEIFCTSSIVNIIKEEGLTSLDEFKNVINLDRYGDDFKSLMEEMIRAKKKHHEDHLFREISRLRSDRDLAISNIAVGVIYSLVFSVLPLAPSSAISLNLKCNLCVIALQTLPNAFYNAQQNFVYVSALVNIVSAVIFDIIRFTAESVTSVSEAILKPILFIEELVTKVVEAIFKPILFTAR